jgi:hypothetical protein
MKYILEGRNIVSEPFMNFQEAIVDGILAKTTLKLLVNVCFCSTYTSRRV